MRKTACLCALVGCVVSGCARQEAAREPSVSELIDRAVFARDDSAEQSDALWELFLAGKEVPCPEDIWYQGPIGIETKSAVEDLMGPGPKRIRHVNRMLYVFYGGAFGEHWLSLLCVRSYPDGKLRFVKLAQGKPPERAHTDPALMEPSLWDAGESKGE